MSTLIEKELPIGGTDCRHTPTMLRENYPGDCEGFEELADGSLSWCSEPAQVRVQDFFDGEEGDNVLCTACFQKHLEEHGEGIV
jgi:hypothetical protein